MDTALRLARRSTRKWAIHTPWDGARRLATSLKISPIVAQCLHNRGLDDPQSARAFLQPRLNNLHPPEALVGAAPAAERLVQATQKGQRIVIYGDYDVDGISGTAILWHVLRLGGADVDFHIPHRLEEGYGLNADALHRLAEGGAHVVVTVDCGITALAEAELARQLGLELIITDHHQAPEQLPDAHIVHPAVEPAYPTPHLCGAGVAFKLAW